jgi:Flp pilus assembly protein TadB
MTPARLRSRMVAARVMTAVGFPVAALCLVLEPGAISAHAAAQAAPTQIAVICFDTNISPAKSQMADERQAAIAYAQALPAGVEVGLIAFNSGWQTVLAPTLSRTQFSTSVAGLKASGGTSAGLGGALAGAVTTITQAGATTGSRILVLSDGELITKAVHAVSVPTDVVTWNFDSDDNTAAVRALATASGGQVGGAQDTAALARLFAAPRTHPSHQARPAAAPTSTKSGMSLVTLLVAVFAIMFALILLGLRSLRPDERRGAPLARQLERYGPSAARPAAAAAAADGDGKLARTAVGLMGQILSSRNAEPRLALRLDRAGINRQPAEWALLGVCVSIVLAAAFTLALGNVLVGVLLGALAGWGGMRLGLTFKIDRRRAAFDEQLPNVLQLIAGSLQTGMSLAQALDAVVREDAQPAAGEFARALAEARLGVQIDVALDGVASRVNSADLRWVIMAIRIQRETGGNLAEVLRNTVVTMRERAYLRRQVRSLSAEGRLSAYILVSLPILVGGWLFYSNPTYMQPLYTTFFGLSMLTIAVVLVIAGAFWMRSMINVKV